MALTTYSELQTAVADWLDRTDLSSQILNFIALAEIRLNREVRIAPMETRHQLTAVGTTGYLQLPARFQGMRSVRLDGDYVDYLPSTYMDASGEYTDSTCYWTIEADQLRILPQLSVGDEVEIVVYQGFAPLSDSNTTNWWMDNAADLLLYAALVEAEPFLKNDDRIVTWAGLFDRGIAKLVEADTNDRVGNNLVIRCG